MSHCFGGFHNFQQRGPWAKHPPLLYVTTVGAKVDGKGGRGSTNINLDLCSMSESYCQGKLCTVVASSALATSEKM